LTRRLLDPTESVSGVRKKNSNRFGIRKLELTIKVQKISIFVKRVIYEVVHSKIWPEFTKNVREAVKSEKSQKKRMLNVKSEIFFMNDS
jgi:hypothetical protein